MRPTQILPLYLKETCSGITPRAACQEIEQFRLSLFRVYSAPPTPTLPATMLPSERQRTSDGTQPPPAKCARADNAKPTDKRIAVELCCGHAGLTKALWEVGFHAIGIDCSGNRHHPVVPILERDLSDPVDQKKVTELIRTASYAHIGLPCGTFTEARNVPFPAWLRTKAAPQHAPLPRVSSSPARPRTVCSRPCRGR